MKEKSLNSLRKIILHAEKIINYAAATGDWWEDELILEAIVFNMAQIGELVRFVEADIQSKYIHVNWAAMKGLRNRIIHDYDDIKPLVIRNIVSKDLPSLKTELLEIMRLENPGN